MNILEIFQNFKTQEQSIEYLENVRWKGQPSCPYCTSHKVSYHRSGDRTNHRWQCHLCRRSFSVTVGTIFHGTHIKLKNWFLILSLMLNAKKSASACQIARDLGMRRPTVWSIMHRIRKAMRTEESSLLKGIVEVDETYIGGKPRKQNKHKDSTPNKRGRGTKKTPIVGAIERGGRVVAETSNSRELSHYGLSRFIKKHINTKESVLITDEYKGYSRMNEIIQHETINHSYEYEKNGIHTNTMEGFWALVKRAWYGQHHHYSKRYTHLYVGEACFKYNARKSKTTFQDTISRMVFA
jgi:transposase-like protein